MGRAIHDRGVHHRALAGARRLQETRKHARHQIHRAPADIAHKRGRRHRWRARLTGIPERAAQPDIGQIMPGGGGAWPALPPTCHPSVNQLGVCGTTRLRPQPQALHHAGAQPFDQPVSSAHQRPRYRQIRVILEVQNNRAFPPIQHRGRSRFGPMHHDHLGAQISQEHARKRRRSQPLKLNNADP